MKVRPPTKDNFVLHILPGMPATKAIRNISELSRLRRPISNRVVVRGYYSPNADAGGRDISIEELDRWQEHCPNCITPWKCNGPHEPRKK